ncbi:MAG: family 43 glycosylhydrolase [Clostridiales bacterium]|nr:family 43 glycosylhydrolase [Clostridiales bacterium]
MPNPILPLWEHIPDGEPRVFGDRVYLYGSHDRPMSGDFCDIRLKVWSAPLNDLDHWVCHGDVFHVLPDEDHPADVTWYNGAGNKADLRMYAPDVVEKDGKYYLYAYVFYQKGCVAVADKPEGPFKVISTYRYDLPEGWAEHGTFVDPGTLVDDDGRVYVYCGFERSYMCELDPTDMVTVLPDTYQWDILPTGQPFDYFEACSPRKIGNTYYLIYSPRKGSRLAYATSDKPTGPFTYQGYIVDNGDDYPGGNDHGSIMKVGDQWYIFYHRMTNGTCFSRQACVERIEIKPDGTIPTVEMTSLGFSSALNPYEETPAHRACVLRGGGMVKYLNEFHTVLDDLRDNTVVGYKYYDFGVDDTATHIELVMELRGLGETGRVSVHLDDAASEPLGEGVFTGDDQLLRIKLPGITGRHAVYFTFHDDRPQMDWGIHDRCLTRLERFVFKK